METIEENFVRFHNAKAAEKLRRPFHDYHPINPVITILPCQINHLIITFSYEYVSLQINFLRRIVKNIYIFSFFSFSKIVFYFFKNIF